MAARVRGHQLAELRKQVGLTQTELAATAGLSQSRISQIENGQFESVETLRAYVVALGGQVDIVARVGEISVKVAWLQRRPPNSQLCTSIASYRSAVSTARAASGPAARSRTAVPSHVAASSESSGP